MKNQSVNLKELFKIAAETHHMVYRKEDGDDPDWASWYSNWLIEHSEFQDLVGKKIVKSHLTSALVKLDKDYNSDNSIEIDWEEYYAENVKQTVDEI